jgi:hypothetical protein
LVSADRQRSLSELITVCMDRKTFLPAFVPRRVRLERFAVDIQCLKVPVLLVISLNLDAEKNSPLVNMANRDTLNSKQK